MKGSSAFETIIKKVDYKKNLGPQKRVFSLRPQDLSTSYGIERTFIPSLQM